MIKPINPSPLNTTNELYYECENCGEKGVFNIDSIVNIDNEGYALEELDYDCPKCNSRL